MSVTRPKRRAVAPLCYVLGAPAVVYERILTNGTNWDRYPLKNSTSGKSAQSSFIQTNFFIFFFKEKKKNIGKVGYRL